MVTVHRFDSTAEARVVCERGEIADGAVLVVAAEKVVGFVAYTEPVAVTEECGEFGRLSCSAHEYADGFYAHSAHRAADYAACSGSRLLIEHASMLALASRADVVLVEAGDDHVAHFADAFADEALCEQPRRRGMSQRDAHRGALCPTCRSRAHVRGASREAEPRPRKAVSAGRMFFPSSDELFGSLECHPGEPRDGNVLVVQSEGIVAIMTEDGPVALTAVHGQLPRLTVPVYELAGGRYIASGKVAVMAASECALELDPLHRRTRGGYAAGTCFVCADGVVRTVDHTEHGHDGHLWLHAADGSAWRADRCEKADVPHVVEARAAILRAVAALPKTLSPVGEAVGAVRELGEALRCLAQASPAARDDLNVSCGQRIALELPRLAVVPGDIVRMHGGRFHVLETGVQDADGEAPRWWADVHGVDETGHRVTCGAPWRFAIPVEEAARDTLTVECFAPEADALT